MICSAGNAKCETVANKSVECLCVYVFLLFSCDLNTNALRQTRYSIKHLEFNHVWKHVNMCY